VYSGGLVAMWETLRGMQFGVRSSGGTAACDCVEVCHGFGGVSLHGCTEVQVGCRSCAGGAVL